ncbi:MAG: MBL fold metallo-hydrolase [Candidatus Heimdallarchaeota archaeon]|nr:MBL fold metallo-hydrolase [Candidatus Heimdallarchaeota archaeon]
MLMQQPYFAALAESNAILETRLPTVFVENERIFRGSKRDVKLICNGKGHTESDLILYLPKEKIVFTGDLVFIDMHPYFADGFIEEWKNYLTDIEKLEIEKLVPGHGNIGDVKDVRIMKDYIEMIEIQVKRMIADGISIKEVESIDVPESFSDWWFKDFFTLNLRFLYEKENPSN